MQEYYTQAMPLLDRQGKHLRRYPAYIEWGYKTLAEIQDLGRGRRIDLVLKPFLESASRRCLDLGCFLGHVSLSLAQLGYEVIGVDTRKDVLDVAETGKAILALNNVKFVLAQTEIMTALFPDESFDVVVMDDLIEHLQDPQAVLDDAFRVLKKGGAVYISAQNRIFPYEPHSRKWFRSWGIPHLAMWWGLKSRMAKSGFLVHNQTVQVLRHLDEIYTTPAHHTKRKFFFYSLASRLARSLPMILVKSLLNLIAEIHFVVGVKQPETPLTFMSDTQRRESARYLLEYLQAAPISMALPRAVESWLFSQQELEQPVLDLGCGNGLFLEILQKRNIYLGLDLQARELRDAQKRGVYKNILLADMRRIPLRDGSVRTIISNSALEHVADLIQAVSEINRLLVRGGRFMFTVPCDSTPRHYLYAELLHRIGLHGMASAYGCLLTRIFRHYNLMSRQRWQEVLEANGFEVIHYRSWHSKRLLYICDLFYPFGILMKLNKILFGRMVIRPRWVSLSLRHLLTSVYEGELVNEEGLNHFFIARKI